MYNAMVAMIGYIGKKLERNRIQAARSLYTNTFIELKLKEQKWKKIFLKYIPTESPKLLL